MGGGSILFTPYEIQGRKLKNRITMAPLFMGYANPDGTVSQLMLDHYREMAASGASLIVVENAAVDAAGLGSPFTIRVDEDRFVPGLRELAETIHQEGALAVLQINHAGRYAYLPERLAPSPYKTGNVTPREMTVEEIRRTVTSYATGARRVQDAGFDGVELHGGTGYLLVQFLSARTNQRRDEYGGFVQNRMRFALEVAEATRQSVGKEYVLGYRFLADEELPDGLHPEETTVFAQELKTRGISYLSVMAGTYDSFFLPHYAEKEKHEAYMAPYAGIIKRSLPEMPVIAAGRMQSPETAIGILEEGAADLIGLARVLLADPLWPKKAQGRVRETMVPCEPTCSLCTKRVMKGKPAYCSQWDKSRRESFLKRIGERGEEDS